MADAKPPGAIRRALRWLFSPSARWSVFALLAVGLLIGATMVIGTQVAVAVTGTDQFCGTTCHSHEKFVYPEHQQTGHYTAIRRNPICARASRRPANTQIARQMPCNPLEFAAWKHTPDIVSTRSSAVVTPA